MALGPWFHLRSEQSFFSVWLHMKEETDQPSQEGIRRGLSRVSLHSEISPRERARSMRSTSSGELFCASDRLTPSSKQVSQKEICDYLHGCTWFSDLSRDWM